MISGAYKATPIRTLETETFIPPLNLYIDSRIAAFQERLEKSPAYKTIQDAAQTIARRLRLNRRKKQTKTLGQERREWHQRRRKALGENSLEKKRVLTAWKDRWQSYNRPALNQIHSPPEAKVLKLHGKLRKAESSALIQMRTGCIGLSYFLNKAKVPGYDTGQCRCGGARETPRHLLLYCSLEQERRKDPDLPHKQGFRFLLNSIPGTLATSKWVI